MRSSSEQRHRFCTVCSNEKACITVDIDTSKKYLCLLHFSIFDKDIPTSTKKSQLKSSILDQVEYSRQSIEVKDLWKEATADVILKMFEYEVEEQRQARLSEVPAILPRTIRNDDRSIVSVPNVGESSVHREASSDADILPAPSYAWRRGLLSEDTELKKNTAVPNSKKRVGTTSLWRTGLQKQSKKEVLEEAERILEIDRINAQGKLPFLIYYHLSIFPINLNAATDKFLYLLQVSL